MPQVTLFGQPVQGCQPTCPNARLDWREKLVPTCQHALCQSLNFPLRLYPPNPEVFRLALFICKEKGIKTEVAEKGFLQTVFHSEASQRRVGPEEGRDEINDSELE